MSAEVRPLVGQQTVTRTTIAVTSAYGGAGQVVSGLGSTSMVRLINYHSPKWPMEYQVAGGAWLSLGPGQSAELFIDLATVALRLRRSEFAPASVSFDIEISGLVTGVETVGQTDDIGSLTAALAAAVASSAFPSTVVGIEKIRPLIAGIARAAYERVAIAMHGTSIEFGVGSNDDPGPALNAADFEQYRTQSFAAVLARLLSPPGTTPSCAYEPMRGTSGTATTPAGGNPLFTPGGGITFSTTTTGAGFSGWRARMGAPGNTCTFTAIGTRFRVYAYTAPGTVQGRWSAPSVSAGATQTVAADGSTATPLGDGGYWYEWSNATDVVPGETVTLIGPASGMYAVYAVDRDARTDAGLSIHRMAYSAGSATLVHNSHLDATDVAGPDASVLGASAAAVNLRLTQAQSLSVRPSNLCGTILHSDVNDLNTWDAITGGGASSWGYTLADHKRHLSNYLVYHASLGLTCLVAFGPVRDPSLPASTRPYDQAQLIAAYKEVVGASSNGAYIDMTAEYPGATLTARYVANQPLLLDVVHPNKTGHAYWAQRIAQGLRAGGSAY